MTHGSTAGAGWEVEDERFPTRGSVTHHTQRIGDREIAFRATADWIRLRRIHKPVAHLFHTAYVLESPEDAAWDAGQARPLTFVFNGGPGAASAYLHMGALGPQRVAFGEMGSLPKPPTRVVDNVETWLQFTDLVFIDPVGTGFSRALREAPKSSCGKESSEDDRAAADKDPKEGEDENPAFWEIERDLDALGEFISRFLSRHHRWTSPLFIAGESYGGFRVARMVRRLQEHHGVGLCGALLISPAIEFEALWGTDYDLTYWIELFPSLAATAHHHKRTRLTGGELSVQGVQQQAEAFAHNELARWLVQGEALQEAELSETVARMSALIGLPEPLLRRANGRISSSIFCRELLRDERRVCGRYDGSITAVDPFPDRDEYAGPDPTLFSIDRLFTGAINHHLRAHLDVETELEYRLLSRDVNRAWKDESRDHVFRKLAGAMDDLRYGMSLNEHMRVFVSHGRFDLVTPCGSSQRLVGLMKLSDAQRERLVLQNFDGGHMFYSWDESRAEFHRAAAEFYNSALHG